MILDHFVRTESFMALLTIHQRVAETAQMPGCHPCLRIHQDGTVHTYIVWIFLDKFLPPGFFYIVFQFHAKLSIVPCIRKTTVNLTPRIDKTSGFCKGHKFVHCLLNHFSFSPL